jgi:hypothetical protein
MLGCSVCDDCGDTLSLSYFLGRDNKLRCLACIERRFRTLSARIQPHEPTPTANKTRA